MILGPLLIGAGVLVAWFVFTGVFQRALMGTGDANG